MTATNNNSRDTDATQREEANKIYSRLWSPNHKIRKEEEKSNKSDGKSDSFADIVEALLAWSPRRLVTSDLNVPILYIYPTNFSDIQYRL